MVVKRRLSPTTMESVSTRSSSSSTGVRSDSGHGDQVLPLYSERIGALHQPYYSYRMTPSCSTGGSASLDDDSDFGDDLSSTCSSRIVTPGRSSSSLFKSSASSVVSEPCLPHWSRTRQQNDSPCPHRWNYGGSDSDRSSTQNTFVFTARKRKNPIYLIVGAFCVLGMFLYSQSHATLHDALQQVLILTEERRKVHAQFHNVEQDIKRLQRQMTEVTTDFEKQQEGQGDNNLNTNQGGFAPTSKNPILNEGFDEMNNLQEKLREGSTRISNLQRHLQEISKHDAIQKYGAGRIRVELELDFPGTHHLKDGPNTLVMELAPVEIMPHSVYMFLEMVDAKLFDGCSFILNAMHVIKAAPLPYDGSSAAAKVRSFAAKGLESVAFREYSPDFPHDQYSVGFAADDSPSFYINTQDNSDVHVGEPCFAKIVSGFDTVRRMEEAPTRNGIWYRQRIGIKRAYIL